MRLAEQEKFLRKLPEGSEVYINYNNGEPYLKGIKVEDHEKTMSVKVENLIAHYPYKSLTCISILTVDKLAPDALTRFSNAVDEELKRK